ncbi:unnamed protein product [Chilo suppressalis]|uniref:Beta-1,4-N-acetylgalactosaminyltransferase n=1 Tax=Chilo suppressalis TaxID=168631 RepID=A0ABN8B3V0_CHISP|nr:unnamed protein product [Chilo suppressalis]
MSPQTLKLLMMFFLAAALLNLTNYVFYWFYDPPSHKAVKVNLHIKLPKTRHFIMKKRITRTIDWMASLICNNNTNNASTDKFSPTEEAPDHPATAPPADYREQSSETNSFYYYNGIRMGPVVCPKTPPGLGPVDANEKIDFSVIENLYSLLQSGGIYEETSCTPRQTVAIIVPYRDHTNQITEFLYSLHPILIKQQLEYQIFLIEQENKTQPLNRGKLFNVGFTEAQKMKKNGGWRCIVFHHFDLVPLDTRNLYRCSDQPRQLVLSLNTNQSYEFQFGGALAIKPHQFLKINGFSNLYIGNDAVYDDLTARLTSANFTIAKSEAAIATYKLLPSINNSEDNVNSNQSQKIQTSSPLNLLDGLSTLTYTISNLDLKSLYTLIEVDLDTESRSHGPGTVSEKLWDKLLNHATSTASKRTSNL